MNEGEWLEKRNIKEILLEGYNVLAKWERSYLLLKQTQLEPYI